MARRVLAVAVPAIDSLLTPANAGIAILPYQLEPALALTSGTAARILIADEVGLGKTVQAGVIIAETIARRQDAHVLVLCPAGLRAQWDDELTKRFHLTPVVLDSASLRRVPLSDGANPWAAHPLVLTSTDYIKRSEVVRALESLVWDLIVIDEAHGIAGNSDRHAAAALLAQRSRAVVMLTATPHSGDDIAFARLASVGDLEATFPLLVFRRTRADTSGLTRRRTRWLRVRLTNAELHMHRALMAYVHRVWRRPASHAARLAMIILTRRACSGALSLARTIERRLALLATGSPDASQLQLPLGLFESNDEVPDAEVGTPGLENVHDERRTLETILALARRAGKSGKLQALARLLRRSNEPAIVFTEYRDTLAALARELTGFATCQLHGGLAAAERADVIHAFTTGRSKVLLATDAASEGLNLQQRCRLVVHLEVPWTPTRIEQRVGRVDRIGQARTVHQVHLVARATVEESRVAAVVQRLSRVASTLSSLSSRRPDERQVAGYVLGNDDPDTSAVALPPGLITVNLRERAETETARLLAARRVRLAASSSSPAHTRPFTSVGRRLPAGQAWWALWLECACLNGQLQWETLIGVRADHQWPRCESMADLRKRVDQSWTLVRNHVSIEHSRVTDHLISWLRTSAARALERENAIARALERHHARLAATLLQGGLFERRTEREAAAQRELLEMALTHCQTRTEELRQRQAADVTASRPAFSLISW
jgi:superfamily II DNA or RNA helicase